MKKIIIALLICCTSTSLSAQKFIDNKLVNYFENDGEVIFTHLNKTHFIKGETIWFKNYLINRKINFLKNEVENLYLTLLNEKQEKIEEAIFYVKNGISFGQFEIDEDFEPGKYYLYFSTNYNNQNKLQHLNHQIPIEIIKKIENNKSVKTYTAIDVQILPESGYGIYDILHRYGVKAINEQGIGVAFNAEVFKEGKKISSFKSNDFGMGAFNLNPQKGKNYTLEITTENQEKFVREIEGIQEKGGIVSTRIHKDYHIIKISQNLNKEGFQHFNLLIHQAGKNFEVDLSKHSQGQELQFKLPINNLFTGVNTITLFYKNKPIAERLIFRHQDNYIKKADVLIKDRFNEALDSINFSFSIEKLENKYTHLSASVLHQNSIANQPKHSIISKLLLSPYIKGNIEKPNSYFKDIDFKKQYNLDLLLLNQGWSRYNWDAILNHEIIDVSKREQGINQELFFLQKTKNFRRFFLIFENMINEDEVFDLDKTKKIETNKIFPIKETTYSFSTFDKKGKHYPAPKFKVNTLINYPKIKLHAEKADYNFEPKTQQQTEIKAFENGELLEDVIVKAKATKEEKKEFSSSLRGKKVEVTDELADSFPLLSDFLRFRGYRVTDTGSQFIIRPNTPQTPPPQVIINGGRVSDLSVLSNRQVADFESIEIDKNGLGQGMWGAGGVIRLKFATHMRNLAKYQKRITEFTMEEGYTKPKAFYTPAYIYQNSNKFQMIAGLGWQPNLTSSNGEFEFSIKNTDFTRYIFFIEGLTEKGEFISIPISHELQSKIFD